MPLTQFFPLTVPRWLFVWLAVAPAVALAQGDPVIVGFDHSAPPFMSAHEDRTVGIYPSLVEAVFRDAKVPLRIESAPFNRVLFNVDRGLWGAGGILKTPARLAKYDFSDYLYLETLVVYYARKRPIHFTKLSDLKGQRVGIRLGWSYGGLFDIAANDLGIEVKAAPSDAANFRKLQMDRLDAVIVLKEAGEALMATGHYTELEKAPELFGQNPAFIAFNKSARRGALIGKLNASIVKLRNAGQFKQIVRTSVAAEHGVAP